MMNLMLPKECLMLFQGDSITDCQRDRGNPGSLGNGYAAMVAGVLRSLYPDLGLRFLNRGVSGDCVTQLCDRWDEDTLSLHPDVLSLLIGVNDTRLLATDPANAPSQAESQAMLRHLVKRAKEQNPGLILVMLEPFLIPSKLDGAAWVKPWVMNHAERVERYREVAFEFDSVYVPLYGMFGAAYSAKRPPETWAEDGVHPTMAGHRLIAEAVLSALAHEGSFVPLR